MIRLESFSFTYADGREPALRGIDLQIAKSQICGVIGPSGSGKSTLCYSVAGIIPHFYHGDCQGHVHVGGVDIAQSTLDQLASRIGLVFQNPFNQITGSRYTVREEVAFGLENLSVPREEMRLRVQAILADTGLLALADRSPFALSGGQQQRLAVASILVMRPQVLVLDEPTSQLDPAGTREVFGLIRQLPERHGTTVLIVEHKLEWLAAVAHRIILLNEGRVLADGSPLEVLGSPQLENRGVRPTRFTLAAGRARDEGLVADEKALPVTLNQAVEFFQS
jgi:energy-coupling factor transport system ATP-binding protein